MNLIKKDIIFNDVKSLKGVGKQLSKYLKTKKIEKIKDIILNLPYSETDRSKITKIINLEVGKIQTIQVSVKKLNFPRIRNLPNKIICEDNTGKIDIVYFNSREGYLRKLFETGKSIIISGKITSFNKKYQMTNPDYVTSVDNGDFVKKIIPKYSLTKGINEKKYRYISDQVINNLPHIEEWIEKDLLKKNNFLSWRECMISLHKNKKSHDVRSNSFRRLVFDEIYSNLLVLSENRKKIKKQKKSKIFKSNISNKIIKKLPFALTQSQKIVLREISEDLKSDLKMFRIVQGDVGSGKTIVSLLSIANVIEDHYQAAFMAPTEILATQHFNLAKEIFSNLNVKVELLTSKTESKKKRKIIVELKRGEIDLIIGTHSLFQKEIHYNNLGIAIIDEQHKFGVKQRSELASKGGKNCDVLLMSATPIPRTMMMSLYGDMDVSKIMSKPLNRKKIITLSKPEKKIDELWSFLKKQLNEKNQVFWVCPLIKESAYLNFSSAKKKFEVIEKKFPGKVGLIHGGLDKDKKENILNKFLSKKIMILVSTTVIEVGVDFPNANLIVIENANKFGLAQLHQLRGRVGRGKKQGVCILLFKESLSKNAIKRIRILKESNDGFYIAEQDMKLRGFGDIIGYQQSGIKNFRFADPVIHEDLFIKAENYIKSSKVDVNDDKYTFLLKLFDKAEIINQRED